MKKRIFGAAVAATVAALALASCGNTATSTGETPSGSTPATSGETPASSAATNVFNVQCWNDEFRGFFNRYVSDEGKALLAKGELMGAETDGMTDDEKAAAKSVKVAKEGYHLDGVPVVFTETPSDGGAYQAALDQALLGNAKAAADKKVDMFLAEADYIIKYADSDYTADVTTLGTAIDQAQVYKYTQQAASDAAGKVKGVSFQCCPSGMIYNRDIAKAVLGTDDPVEVQKAVADWDKFAEVAAQCKTKGYYVTACSDETYRVFSNNSTTPWVVDGKLAIPAVVDQWIAQAKDFVDNEYTVVGGVWSGEKTANITAGTEKALACFGPAWYYNFCMGAADQTGKWALCQGPQAHFWGGTWILAATGTDNADLVAKVMNAFVSDQTVLKNLVEVEGQFTNNMAYNESVAAAGRSNAFLGGQNDTAVFCELAKGIKWENATIYDQLCNEGITSAIAEYLTGAVDLATAKSNFVESIKEQYPDLA